MNTEGSEGEVVEAGDAPEMAGMLGPIAEGGSGESRLVSVAPGIVVGGSWVAAVVADAAPDDDPHTPRIDCMASRSCARKLSLNLNSSLVRTNPNPCLTNSVLMNVPSRV